MPRPAYHPSRIELERAFRACPGLAERTTLEAALQDNTLRLCLTRVAQTHCQPRRKPWAKYFTS